MTNQALGAETLDTVLAALHEMLEDGATRDDVLRFAGLNGGYRNEILAFVAEWFASAGSDLGDEDPTGSQTASGHNLILERFWAAEAKPEPDPFEAMDSNRIGRIAANCRIDTGILRKLSRCLIDVGTVPGQLIVWLAEELDTSPAELSAHLCNAPVAANVDFFAPSGRSAAGKVSFETAVATSTLDPAQKRFWFPDLKV